MAKGNSGSGKPEDKGIDDPINHDVGDDKGVDDPLTHDVGDDKGVDDPLTHDIGDDKGVDDPLTHDIGDDKGADDPLTHDVGDDHGGHHQLHLFLNQRTQQFVFTDDRAEHDAWMSQPGKLELDLPVVVPDDSAATVSVWRFHDAASDVYFWTADAGLKDSILHDHPELEFHGEAFQAFDNGGSGGRTAIGVAWDHGFDGAYGRFIYGSADDMVQLAGQSSTDDIDYLGVAFWI